MAITSKFYVTLPDSVAEELHNLGEFYQVGPATLASYLLAGIIQPLAASAERRGPVSYRPMRDVLPQAEAINAEGEADG